MRSCSDSIEQSRKQLVAEVLPANLTVVVAAAVPQGFAELPSLRGHASATPVRRDLQFDPVEVYEAASDLDTWRKEVWLNGETLRTP